LLVSKGEQLKCIIF